MAIAIAILTALGGALLLWVRRNPNDVLNSATDAVTVARNAPRRMAFRKQTREHPVQSIEDPVLAIVTIATGFLELKGRPLRDDLHRLTVTIRKTWRMTEEEADELIALANWLVEQSGGGQPAVDRVARRLYRLDEGASWPLLSSVLRNLANPDLSVSQQEALAALQRQMTRPEKS